MKEEEVAKVVERDRTEEISGVVVKISHADSGDSQDGLPLHRTAEERKRGNGGSTTEGGRRYGGFMPESGRRTVAGSCHEPPGRGSEREERGGAGDTTISDFFQI
jgi:hypothetical protein